MNGFFGHSRRAIAFLFLLLAVWVSIPRIYIHELLEHEHHAVHISADTELNAAGSNDCSCFEFDRTAPLIGNMPPLVSKLAESTVAPHAALTLNDPHCIVFRVRSLRAPPATA